MCGRFVASSPVEDIVEAFGVEDVDLPTELVEPRWNVAPQSAVLAVTMRAPRETALEGDVPPGAGSARRRLSLYRWGLVPSWAKDPSIGGKMFNARAEGIEEKAAFRAAVAKRRCLVPADAFYEWKRVPPIGAWGGAARGQAGRPRETRQPWCFRPADGGLFAFAGLWEAWRPRQLEGAEWLLTCTIVTTDANATVAPVHDRMPVILEPEDWDRWLSPRPLELDQLRLMLRPAREDLVTTFPVRPDVNDARAEGPELSEPIPDEGEPSTQPSLFEG